MSGILCKKVSTVPASMSKTFHFGFSESRFARTHPAGPLKCEENFWTLKEILFGYLKFGVIHLLRNIRKGHLTPPNKIYC